MSKSQKLSQYLLLATLMTSVVGLTTGCKSSSSSPGATSDTIGGNPALPPGSEVIAAPDSPSSAPPSDVASGSENPMPVVVIPEDSSDEIDQILDQAVEQVAVQPAPVIAQPAPVVAQPTEPAAESSTQSSTSPEASATESSAPAASAPEAVASEVPSDPAQETLAEMESEEEGVIPEEVASPSLEPEVEEEEIEVVEIPPTAPPAVTPTEPAPAPVVTSNDLKLQITGSVRSAMGWNGSKGFVKFTSNAVNGVYLCRLGKKDLIDTLNFKPCDGKTGNEATLDPSAFKAGTQDGSYRLQAKVVDSGKQSKVKQRTLYYHSSLNGVALCEHKHSSDEYFKVAQALIDTEQTFAPYTRLRNPFIKIGFIEPEKTKEQIAALKKSWQQRFRDTWHDYQKEQNKELKKELALTAADYENELAELQEEEQKLKLAVEQWEKDNKDLKKKDKDKYQDTLAQLKERRDQRLREIDEETAAIKKEMTNDKKEIQHALNDEKKDEHKRFHDERESKLKKVETSQRKVANLMSLRREFIMSKDGKYLLIRRRYPSRSQGGCGNNFTIGMKTRSKAAGFESKKVNCHGFVINAEGQGICLQEDGQALEVVKYATRAWRVLGSGKHDKPFSRKTASENKASDKVLYLPK